jgi:DNA-binding transcriptional ArsR family regulator
MVLEPNIAGVAALLAEPSRSMILTALMDGSIRPAGELARLAGIRPQTASLHLDKLLKGGLVRQETQGRFRYFRLASAEVAKIVESMAAVAAPATLKTTRDTVESRALRAGRTCYDHLAGRLGVDLARALLRSGVVELHTDRWQLGPQGPAWLGEQGISAEPPAGTRRQFAPACLDWSERQFHIGGWLGAQLVATLFDRNWIERGSQPRVVHVTRLGQRHLKEQWNVESDST